MPIRVLLIILFALSVYPLNKSEASDRKVEEVDTQIRSKSDELRETERVIRQRRTERDTERKREDEHRRELGRIDSTITSLSARQKRTKREQKETQRLLSSAQKSLDIARSDSSTKQLELMRVINILHLEKYNFSVVKLNTTEFRNADIIGLKNEEHMEALSKEKKSESDVSKRQEAKKRLARRESQLSENLSKQRGLREDREKLLSSATARRTSIERELRDLSETASALRELLAKLEREKKQILGREELRPRNNLPWPVTGELVMRFGRNKREGGATFISDGIRIKPDTRSPVRAVEGGECVFAGSFRSYGQMVILYHGGTFYSIYGFLEEILIEEGASVQAGQQIAIAGANENTIHFKIRFDGRAVDPLLWLRQQN